MSKNKAAFSVSVYRLVSRIPNGRVVTYGQIAAYLDAPRAARAVGNALRRLPLPLVKKVPWQRVINSTGRISCRNDFFRAEEQRSLLGREGIQFSHGGTINLKKYRWHPPEA